MLQVSAKCLQCFRLQQAQPSTQCNDANAVSRAYDKNEYLPWKNAVKPVQKYKDILEVSNMGPPVQAGNYLNH